MQNFRKNLLIAVTVFGLSAVTVTGHTQNAAGEQTMSDHSGNGKHDRSNGHRSPERMKEAMTKRQAALRNKLDLNPAQESAWEAFSTAMTSTGKRTHPDRAEWANLTVPERMEKMHAMMKEREASMAARIAATNTFYAALTAEQQKIFNENFMTGRRHGKAK